jgi:DNA repair protein RadC
MATKPSRGPRAARASGEARSRTKRTAPAPVDAAAALRAIQASLSERAEKGALTAFLRRIRHRAADARPLDLDRDGEAVRFLWRLGVVTSQRATRRTAEEAAGFLERASRSGGPDPAVGSVLVRGFASGIYGVAPDAVCGDSPRCGDCALAHACRERNAPRRGAPEYGPGEAPSERILTEGPESLSNAELLSLLAGRGRREARAVLDCEGLLEERGGLRALADARPSDLAEAPGLGKKGARAVAAAMELARRWAAEPRPVGRAFRSGADFFRHYRVRMRDLRREVFVSVLLDQKNRFLADEVCSEGSLTASLIHPRDVFRRAVRESAAAVAFVHNHPSGDPSPSPHDREITSRLAEVAKLLGVRFLDHVIVGDTSYVSFAEKGWL